jgi:hypothetical protein
VADEIQRDAEGRFASGSKVALDALPTMEAYNSARDDGATETIDKSELEANEPPKVTGKEDLKTYNERRDEQQQRSKGSGSPKAEKRISQLTKEKYTERERADALERRLQEYERGQANGESNGADSRSQDFESHSQPEQRSETPEPTEPKIAALRQHYPDWDAAMSRAKNENIRISDEAAKVLRSVENAGHISYLLVKNDELRTEFNKLSPEGQVKEIKNIDEDFRDIHSGRKPFRQAAEFFKGKVDAMEAAMSPDERSEVLQAAQKNQIGQGVVLTLVRELDELSNGPQVFKFLITNPEESRRLATMSQTAASLELGRLSKQLEQDESRAFVSKSAPPIKPVSGGYSGSSVPLDKVQSMREYNAHRDRGRQR